MKETTCEYCKHRKLVVDDEGDWWECSKHSKYALKDGNKYYAIMKDYYCKAWESGLGEKEK